MTLQQASKQLLFQLYHLYEKREAANIADLVMENITEWKRIDRVINKELVLSPAKQELLEKITVALLAHQPVQYVLNEAWFYGMKFYVDENVLIPRPETEELVEWLLQEKVSKEAGTKILDVGTGSGCIAIALKKKLPLADVYACDISEKALNIAAKNARKMETGIQFIQCDFLNPGSHSYLPQPDIIISNPPYIPMKDQQEMRANVLLYEPPLALFVADEEPLVFYQAIAAFAGTHLADSGSIFVETHDQLATDVKMLFIHSGFSNVALRKDMQGGERMVRAILHQYK